METVSVIVQKPGYFEFLRITQDLNQTKKSRTLFCNVSRNNGKQEPCGKFQQKIFNSTAAGARQSFQFFRQNLLFLENSRALYKTVWGFALLFALLLHQYYQIIKKSVHKTQLYVKIIFNYNQTTDKISHCNLKLITININIQKHYYKNIANWFLCKKTLSLNSVFTLFTGL